MEREILNLFLHNHKLKFNKIEKELEIRSNKLAYHLNKLIKKGILTKQKDFYKLSKASEYLIPYLSNKKSPLPVLLIHIGDKNKCFLHKRKKRPFKNKLSLPGGRLKLGESIKQGVKRIIKRYNINAKFEKISSISLEHVKKKKEIIHSFLLIFIKAKTKKNKNIKMTNVDKNKKEIISSDYKLIKSNPDKKEFIDEIITKLDGPTGN